jgi:hypothetical protein
MKKNVMLLLLASLFVMASVMSAFGQDKQPAPDKEFTFEREIGVALTLDQEPPVTVGGNTFTFVNSEFSFDRLVKGAPYSAQAITEMTQILSDGNRIVNTSTAAVYRDGEGRTRREQTLKAIGPFAPSGEPLKSISINDPVAGVAYVLEPHSHMARKIQGFRIESGGGGAAGGFKVNSSGGEGGNFTFTRTTGGEVQVKAATAEAKIREEKERTGFRNEDLGTQTVEGVSAVGTRTTVTIPAGQIGNERAIEIVDERWFSQELQTMVMTRHNDPRSGESVYRLTNISRTEPDHSLFEVPSDYTLRDDQPMRFRTEKQEKQVP